MMSLKERITEDMKAALRSQDKQRLSAIRLLLAAIKQREVDERIALDDAAVLSVIEKMLKQRRDSITQFRAGGRADLAAAEEYEIEVLTQYMPQALSAAQIEEAVTAAVSETGAQSMRDMGKVMAALRPGLAGRADMALVSSLVKSALARG
jgi:hypothetical protein